MKHTDIASIEPSTLQIHEDLLAGKTDLTPAHATEEARCRKFVPKPLDFTKAAALAADVKPPVISGRRRRPWRRIYQNAGILTFAAAALVTVMVYFEAGTSQQGIRAKGPAGIEYFVLPRDAATSRRLAVGASLGEGDRLTWTFTPIAAGELWYGVLDSQGRLLDGVEGLGGPLAFGAQEEFVMPHSLEGFDLETPETLAIVRCYYGEHDPSASLTDGDLMTFMLGSQDRGVVGSRTCDKSLLPLAQGTPK